MHSKDSTKPVYDHYQLGHAILAMAFPAEAGILITCFRQQQWMAALLFTALVVFLALCFFSLRVVVDDAAVRLTFGAGFLKREFLLKSIISCHQVRNSLFTGWGVRRLRRGGQWLYNVSGFDAVELRLENGQVIRIGTDDPTRLLEVIRTRMGKI